MAGFTPQKIRSIIVKASPSPAFKPQAAEQLSAPKVKKPLTSPAPRLGRASGQMSANQAGHAMKSGYGN